MNRSDMTDRLMSKPYKGMVQPRLKAHEKFTNRKCSLAAPLPGGGYMIYLWLPAYP